MITTIGKLVIIDLGKETAQYFLNGVAMGMSDVTRVPLSTTIEVATVAMLGRGDMTAEQTIVDFKRINDEFWVKLA